MDSQQFKLPDAWRFEIYSWWLLGFVPCLERFCPFSTLKHVLWCFTPMLLQFRISLSFLTYLKLIIAYGLILGTKIISKWRLSNSKVIYWMFHDFHWFKMPCLTQAKLSFIQRFFFFCTMYLISLIHLSISVLILYYFTYYNILVCLILNIHV